MTFSEDFFEEEAKLDAATPTYPTAFGVTLTPAVSGLLIGVLGLGGALYLLVNMVMPAMQQNQELAANRDQKQAEVQQKQAGVNQTEQLQAELDRAQQQSKSVLGLFASESTLDTLLLDLNRQIESSNASLSGADVALFNRIANEKDSKLKGKDLKAKLIKFEPATQNPDGEVVTDGSLGAEVNGKLKRRAVNITLEATYEQTQAIMRNLERLQPLLIVRDYNSTSEQTLFVTDSRTGAVRHIPTKINTSFQLQALMPIDSSEAQPINTTAEEQPK